MLLIVGIGNPGREYANNRHNIGFMAADEIIRRYSFSAPRARFHGLISEGRLGSEKVLVLKPTTYMNESGRAVGEAMRFYKLAPEDIVVFHDELDLAVKKIRVKKGGGTAGHNGIRSIAAHIGPDFRRVRIGIAHPGEKSRVSNHVLGDFSKADQEWIEPLLTAIGDHAALLASGEDATFANRLHTALHPEQEKKKKKDGGPNTENDTNDKKET